MGSHPTLDDHQLAAEALGLDPGDWEHHHADAHLAVEHPQVRAWPEGDPDLAHQLDHRDWLYDHTRRSRERDAEQAFDRLNPEFGVPVDRSNRIGHRDVQQHEAALALGVRVAVHNSRQNDRDPVIWQPGQDYRMADALHAARHQPTRTRWGPSGSVPNANHHQQHEHHKEQDAWQQTTTPPSSATWSTTPSCATSPTAPRWPTSAWP